MAEAICVWTDGRRPVRVVWCGQRYIVSDTPTPLLHVVGAPEMTHPLEPQWGWRFQGTNEGGESFVFDVRVRSSQTWDLVAIYD
jgi:hypothetical protein